ncbi:MAG: 6-phosphogluconolactonase [Chitinophagaceae bacterium]
MHAFISKNSDELSVKFADWLVNYTDEVLKKQDRFTLVLSGGSTPRKLYKLLASEQYKNRIDWSKLHFFWGDERFVPLDDERNNAKMAFDELLDHVPVNQKHIHIMATIGPGPEESAVEYEKLLHEYFDNTSNTFDLVMLGLGSDAHTLSLFPGYPVIMENEKWVSALYLKEQDMYRITLTPPVVNNAARVVFLVSGGDKAAALYHVLSSEHEPYLYPAQIIQPFNSELYWFYDEAAAADL